MKRTNKLALFIPLLLTLVLSSSLYAKSQAKIQDEITAIVTMIVDGDTLKINHKGQEESIRLIGIDTPESKAKKDAQRSKSDVETITAMAILSVFPRVSI